MLTQLVDSKQSFNGPDIQTTSFSIDAISRFVCNTLDEALAAQSRGGWEFDVIVIGSGMYGAYAASKLYNFNRSNNGSNGRPRVLVLEAGPFLISEHFQNLTKMGSFFDLVLDYPVENSQTHFTQINPGGELEKMTRHHKCVGGKSLFWGGWAPRLKTEDFNRVDENGNRCWPEEVVSFLKSNDGYNFIEEQIGVNATADFVTGQFNQDLKNLIGTAISGAALNELKSVVDAPIAVQAQSPESGLFSMDKFSSLPLLLSSVREDAEREKSDDKRFLFVVPNTSVLKMETSQGVVSELLLLSSNLSENANSPGKREQVRRLKLKDGAMVILAGNTINSTRLALNSFPRETDSAKMMGKNLMAHIRGNYVWRVHRSLLNLPTNNNPAASFSTAALHVAGEFQNLAGAGKPGNFHLQFYGVGSTGEDPEKNLYQFVPHLDDIKIIRESVLSTNIKDWIVVGIRSCGEMNGKKNIDFNKKEQSFISVNPFGGDGDDVYFEDGQEIRIPKAFMCLVESKEDADLRKRQTEISFNLIAAITNQPLNIVQSFNTQNKAHLLRSGEDTMGSTYHESGTLFLGANPNESVTDVNGRFHSVANVYCVDQSIFPSVGSANPVPTGLALCQKIVRNISARFTSNDNIPLEPGFTKLFDGNLNGWAFYGEGEIKSLPGLDIIEAGTAGVIDRLGFLRFETQQFDEFILKLEYKSFSVFANSGIFIHMPALIPGNLNDIYSQCLEIQIDETGKNSNVQNEQGGIYGSPLHKTGAIYQVAPATRSNSKAISPRISAGYWNQVEVHSTAGNVKVIINGQVISEALSSDFAPRSGFIALQCHTDVVQFRNIRVKV